MKRIRTLLILRCLTLLALVVGSASGSHSWVAAVFATPSPNAFVIGPADVRIVATASMAGGQRLTIAASLPELRLEPDGGPPGPASRALVAGWPSDAAAGMPLLPQHTVWLALPAGGRAIVRSAAGDPGPRFENVRLAIAPRQVWSNPPLPGERPSAPILAEQQPAAPARPGTPLWVAGFWPPALARLEAVAQLRDQSFVPLTLYAAQWDAAAGRLQSYRRLIVQVDLLDGGARSGLSNGRPDPLWRDVLDGAFINHATAPAVWRRDPSPQRPATIPLTEGLRLSLPSAGLYSLPLSQFAAAGAPAAWLANPSFLRFYQGDRELPRAIEDATVALYLPPYDTRQNDAGGVIVRYTPGIPGRTPALRAVQPPAGQPLAAYSATQRLEAQSLYVSQFPAAEDADHWWWRFWVIYGNGQATPPIVIPFDRDQQSQPGQAATITLRLHGGVWGNTHQISVTLNAARLGVVQWNGTGTLREASLAVPAGALQATNTLTLTALGSVREVGYLDWVEVRYPRNFAAVAGRLEFDGPGGAYAVSGLGGEPVDLWDISDPQEPVILSGYANDAASVRWNESGSRRYLAQARSQRLTIGGQAVRFWSEPDLRSPLNSADYLAITYNPPASTAWSDALAPLLARRAAGGLRTALIDVQWIYDQFGDGRVDAAAIRSFISHAYAVWAAPAPSYALLVGDGTADPHDYEQILGAPATNFIPPYLAYVDPWLGETAADNRYVAIAGADDIPDLHLGRLPARSAAEIATMVAKILAYEQTDPAAPWLRRVLLVADDPDAAGDFPALSDALLPLIPTSTVTATLYYGTGGDVGAFRGALIAAINTGHLFVNYVGHAGIDVWADPVLYNRASVAALANGDKLAIMLPMTCYTGHFQRNDIQALAEEELRSAGGGAVAAWAPAGLGLATGHDFLDRGVLDAVLNHGVRRLGPATTLGKLALAAHPGLAPDLLNTYLLFGDPALQIPLDFAPIAAAADALAVDRNASATFDPRTNDTDPYGNGLVVVSASAPANGTATVSADGTGITYAPRRHYSGGDQFQYTLLNPANGSRAEATVTVQIVASDHEILLPLLGR